MFKKLNNPIITVQAYKGKYVFFISKIFHTIIV